MVNETTNTAVATASSDRINENATSLGQEINWFAKQVNLRLSSHFAANQENDKEFFLNEVREADSCFLISFSKLSR